MVFYLFTIINFAESLLKIFITQLFTSHHHRLATASYPHLLIPYSLLPLHLPIPILSYRSTSTIPILFYLFTTIITQESIQARLSLDSRWPKSRPGAPLRPGLRLLPTARNLGIGTTAENIRIIRIIIEGRNQTWRIKWVSRDDISSCRFHI